jgi:hypothetical protein
MLLLFQSSQHLRLYGYGAKTCEHNLSPQVFVRPLFKSVRVTASTPVQKRLQKQNHARSPLEPLELSGAVNEWLPLIVEKTKLPDSYTSVAPE